MLAVMLAQLEGEYDHDHAEDQRLRPDPPSEHESTDQRADNQKHAMDQRHDPPNTSSQRP